ncbi:MAG: DNA methyltransferase [Micavibrio aeruginosavorus]|uniref:site-specific DNA-methyltransferase (adenine-specific) n=1 Tax=Micavibrio aeruginosavorus TaxID=349221 RepID=A0A2W5FKN8_9BACT|nr:MAG: DNA methyltransferase [Micavibrio aeruginosavorus]
MNLTEYVQDISKRFAKGDAREHTYRGSLQNLLETIIPNIQATNEPARIKCGAPDYVLTRKDLPIGYIEAKDVDEPLDKVEKTEQLKRYLESLDNLILTDYLEFRFFKNTVKVETVRIAKVDGKSIVPIPENFERLKTLLIDFAAFQGQTIKSAKKLAAMMAQKAKLMRDVFENILTAEEDSTLKDQMRAFKTVLMHDLEASEFADIYAQTIAYGLFTARLHDTTLETFSRSEALLLIPASNPFLRQLFSYVAGPELDTRVIWIVDALCDVYRATDLKAILKDFGTATGQNDPVLHFYETFLGEYDKSLKKARGVWYTPEPVVQYIVRAIDDVLKGHFDLKEGLADTSKIEIEVDSDRVSKKTGKREKDKKSIHTVQLLDVATGTGTFLAETIKQIYRKFDGMEGLWSRYVDNELLPRLHGFELLMASYAMCHMKIDLLLQETGYKPLDPNKPPRVSVYLTNSLEEYHPDADTLFASWLSHEANAASRIKKDMPIMVAFGNPPYAVSSSNKGKWIQNLIADYKKDLNEKKINLDDDYIKFIRYAEHYIERTGYGIIAMITNNSFLDGVTHRQMRKHLLETFDSIYIYDLHGSAKKKETAPDGSKDENVFDIQQGVSISIFVKTRAKSKELAEVYHADSYGLREDKYDRLVNQNLKTTGFSKVQYKEPYYFFTPITYSASEQGEYSKGFSITDLFIISNNGLKTDRDDLFIDDKKPALSERIQTLLSQEIPPSFIDRYEVKDSGSYKITNKISGKRFSSDLLDRILYRPLDTRWIYYDADIISRPASKVMRHFTGKSNLGLIIPRQVPSSESSGALVTNCLAGHKSFSAYNINTIFPLYLYETNGGLVGNNTSNLEHKLYEKIKKDVPELTPENLFDFIYAVLHAPAYRKRYAEFLKIDFPRIPYPPNSKSFHALAEKGAELRGLHLMESDLLEQKLTTYPNDGNHEVIKPRFGEGKVWINETQYFGNVPEIVWNFYIGGYQPAQKWLKDRKERNLSIDDIRHYQRIIIALNETDRIMKEIDQIDFLPN